MAFLFRYFLILISLSLVSCLQNRPSRLSQSLEGTIVSLSDVFNLKCVLRTGENLEQKVNWTDADHVVLEEKTEDGQYEAVKKKSIAYDVVNKAGEKTKGYINDFSYVAINSIEDSNSQVLASKVGGESEAQIIQKGKLRCANLLTPEQHPFIIAKAHHTYNLEFQVYGNYLRALIVASPEDIPFQALPYSIKLKDNRYGMPIGGYGIGLGYLEEVVNSDFEATRILTFRDVPIKSKFGQKETFINDIPTIYPQGVTEIQVRGDFRPFKTLLESGEKKDVYPKNLLAGDWYYGSTVVATSVGQSRVNGRGFIYDYDSEHEISQKIKIVFKDNHLIAYSLNVEEDVPSFGSLNKNRLVFKIPIQHLSYEASSSLSGQIVNAGLNEVLNKREDDADKNLVKVNFSQIETSYTKYLNEALGQPSLSLHELHLSKDFFSFTLYDEQQGAKIKYALLRPKQNNTYTPLNVSQKSHNLFPAFYVKKRNNNNNLAIASKEYQQSYLVNRFNTNEPIVYRFSTLTPKLKYVRDIGRETINLWNQVFQKAGITCSQKDCFVLDESKDVELGDIRYNILNLTNPKELLGRASFLGFATAVSDFETGELVSATSSLILNSTYNSITTSIYNYILDVHGLDISYWRALRLRKGGASSHQTRSSLDFLKRQLFSGQLRELFIPNGLFGSKVDNNSVYRSVYGLNLDDSLNNGKVKFVTSIDEIISTKEDRNRLALQYKMATGEEVSSSLSASDIYKKITESKVNISAGNSHECLVGEALSGVGVAKTYLVEALCEQELQEAVGFVDSTLSPHEQLDHLWNMTSNEDFKNKIFACVEKVLPIVSIGTLVHEVGHNLSMYHNFAASADKDNFLELKDFKLNYVLSHLTSVEKEKVLKLKEVQPSSSSLMDYMSSLSVTLIPGRYDVDFVRFVYGGQLVNRLNNKTVSVDPMTFTDLTNNQPLNIDHIRTYKVCNGFNTTDVFCQRWDLGTTAEEIVKNEYKLSVEYYDRVERFFQRIIPFYHKWRLELSKSLEGSDTYYLSSFDESKEYLKVKKEICADKKHKLGDYCRASRVIVSKLIDNLSKPDHYCVVKYNYTKEIDRIPFRDLHAEIIEQDAFSSLRSSCKDLEQFLSLAGYELLDEVGRPFFDMNFSTSRNNKPLHTMSDRSGSVDNKMNSVLGLLASTKDRISFYDGGDRPISIMDEPDVRSEVHKLLKTRLLKGDYQGKEGLGGFTYNFSNEKLFLDFASKLLFKNMNATNIVKGYQNEIKRLVEMVHYARFKKEFADEINLRVRPNYLRFYKNIRQSGGHIIGEDEYHERKQTESFLIIPFTMGKDNYLPELIEGIRQIGFIKSLISLWKTVNELNKEENIKLRKSTSEKFIDFSEKIPKDILIPSVKLLETGRVLGLATMSLLYDYLERGKDTDLITDDLIPYLQMSKISALRVKTLGLSKDIEVDFSKNQKPYMDFIINSGASIGYNAIKPNLKALLEYFDKNPDALVQASPEILTVCLLELFKSSKYDNSQVHVDLKILEAKVIDVLENRSVQLHTESSHFIENGFFQNITEDLKNVIELKVEEGVSIQKLVKQEINSKTLIKLFKSFKERILKVKEVRHFRGNKFLRELLIRDLFIAYDDLPKPGLVEEDVAVGNTAVGNTAVGNTAVGNTAVGNDLLQLLKQHDAPEEEQSLISSLVKNDSSYLYISYTLIKFIDIMASSEVSSDELFHNNLMETMPPVNEYFASKNIYNFSGEFTKTVVGTMKTLYFSRSEFLFSGQSLPYFSTQDRIHKYNTYFSRLLDNRLEREMRVQEEILYNIIKPFFNRYNR